MSEIAEPVNEVRCWYCRGKGHYISVSTQERIKNTRIPKAEEKLCRQCNGMGIVEVEVKR